MMQVMIWDDHQGKCIGELSFRSQVSGRSGRIWRHTDLLVLVQAAEVGNAVVVQNPRIWLRPHAQVRAVRLRRDRIVVALEHKVLVYNFADLKVLHQIDTCANMRGLVAISSTTAMSATADNTVLACPGYQTGQVREAQQVGFFPPRALCCMPLFGSPPGA